MARGKFVRNALLRAVLLCATIFFVVAFCAEAKKSTEWDKDPKHCEVCLKVVGDIHAKVKGYVQKIDRPDWNSSSLWPHRFVNFPESEAPPLARMFKPATYWNAACNPKPRAHRGARGSSRMRPPISRRTGVSSPRARRARELSGDKHTRLEIKQFETTTSKASKNFRKHMRDVDTTPIPWGHFHYVPPMPIREYPMLEKTIREKGDDMLRKFRRLNT